ncbi:MAG: cobalamin-dependent protein [Deltaproteobacteria bacterium]|nr:cobalamin-dependent protein [Deltaproteobacteria bacterium]
MGKGEITYPLRVAIHRTGLSAERLRAWELRYGAVEPVRTPGGSRRYRESDLERLSLLRAGVDRGRRIGELVRLDTPALRAYLKTASGAADAVADFSEILEPLARLEADVVLDRLAGEQAGRGSLEFAQDFVLPLLAEVGRRWEQGELSVAAEHLASNLLSSMLGESLREAKPAEPGAAIVFATPSGERHALGLFVAALTAAHAGAEPIFLGAEVPEDDLVESVLRSRASVLALGLVTIDSEAAAEVLRRLRARLPGRIEIWIGGPGMPRCAPIPGVERVANLDQLASRVALTRLAADRQAS